MEGERFQKACALLGFQLSDEKLTAFATFEDRLYEANQAKNLTRVPKEECWLRHFLDSLLIQDLIPTGASVLDIGSGPGFPAWPLACARPDIQVLAVDSNGKMLAFLDGQPLPNLRTAKIRAEELEMRQKFDVVTGRAVAKLPIQIELSAAPLKLGGKAILMRTENDRNEIEQLDPGKLGLRRVSMEERLLAGYSERILRLFPIYEKAKATPQKYPRPWQEILRSSF